MDSIPNTTRTSGDLQPRSSIESVGGKLLRGNMVSGILARPEDLTGFLLKSGQGDKRYQEWGLRNLIRYHG